MQLRKLFAAFVTVLAAGSLTASAQTSAADDPMSRAVMETYDQMILDNPSDYQAYFRRANAHYNFNQYSEAMADINSALQYAPKSEKDLRFQCLMLRASILERMKMYAEAVSDLKEALAIDATNYAALYQKANLEYAQGNYSAARTDYTRLQAINSRSQEALFGLARVAVKEGDTRLANKYIDEAVDLTPSAPESYIHRAAVRTLMDDKEGAVNDYIVAIDLGKDASLGRALQGLMDLSYIDYEAVNDGLSRAISRSPRMGLYYYIRGIVAQQHFHYPAAIADFEYVTKNYLLDHPAIYRCLAECYYALARYDDALNVIDIAIGSSADNIDAYVVKSDIKRALKTYTQAITAADRALSKDARYAPALLAKGLAQLRNGFTPEASISVGSAVLAAPRDPYYIMVRAWLLADFQQNAEIAHEYYDKVLQLETYPDDDIMSLRGFALLYTDRVDEADEWIDSVLASTSATSNAETWYYATCYYAARGLKDKAFDCMERALAAGYANLHNWRDCDDARINVAPLRTDPRFDTLLKVNSNLFK